MHVRLEMAWKQGIAITVKVDIAIMHLDMDHDLNCSLLYCKFGPGTGEYASQVSGVLLGNNTQ